MSLLTWLPLSAGSGGARRCRLLNTGPLLQDWREQAEVRRENLLRHWDSEGGERAVFVSQDKFIEINFLHRGDAVVGVNCWSPEHHWR